MTDGKKPEDQPEALPEVFLGENKVVQRVIYKEGGTSPKFGVVVLIPSRQDQGKTYYKPLAMVCNISTEQRNAIIRLLGGTPPCN